MVSSDLMLENYTMQEDDDSDGDCDVDQDGLEVITVRV